MVNSGRAVENRVQDDQASRKSLPSPREKTAEKDVTQGSRFRLERFGKAMVGTASWEAPYAILHGWLFLSDSLKPFSVLQPFVWLAFLSSHFERIQSAVLSSLMVFRYHGPRSHPIFLQVSIGPPCPPGALSLT